jgi:hypothetical protein
LRARRAAPPTRSCWLRRRPRRSSPTPTPEDGIRTIFSFAADSARGAQAWLVQEISRTDGGYMRVRAMNYASEYYAADALAIPAKAGVIN